MQKLEDTVIKRDKTGQLDKWQDINEQLPPIDEKILVVWRGANGLLNYGISSRNRVTQYHGKDAPMEDRYWAFPSNLEIKPLYWMPLFNCIQSLSTVIT